MIIPLLLCAAAHVVDGDTIRCSAAGRIRLASIDAPDKVNSVPCRSHTGDHVCDDAKAAAASVILVKLTQGKRITYRVVGYDAKWHRTVGQMKAGHTDLQCAMIKAKAARYLPAYDKRNGFVILHHCPKTVKLAGR